MPRDALEVRIGAQEEGAGVKAGLGDDAIGRASDGDALAAQRAEEAGGPHMQIHRRLNRRKCDKNPPRCFKTTVGAKSLKDLRDDDREDGHVVPCTEDGRETIRVRALRAVEEIGPRVRIDDDHERDVLADLQASTSPSHASLPRSRSTVR